MERLTETCWRNLDPWECCGQDHYCQRGCHDEGGCTNGCIVPELYDRLAAYEDTGLAPEEITGEKPACVFYCNRQCNLNGDFCAEGPGCPFELDDSKARQLLLQFVLPATPLTLDELREMDGEPVWVERHDGGMSGWAIVGDADSLYGFYFVTVRGGMRLPYGIYGEMWLAYRRKPEDTQA